MVIKVDSTWVSTYHFKCKKAASISNQEFKKNLNVLIIKYTLFFVCLFVCFSSCLPDAAIFSKQTNSSQGLVKDNSLYSKWSVKLFARWPTVPSLPLIHLVFTNAWKMSVSCNFGGHRLPTDLDIRIFQPWGVCSKTAERWFFIFVWTFSHISVDTSWKAQSRFF